MESSNSKNQNVVYVVGTSSAGKTSAVQESVKKLDGFRGWYVDEWAPTARLSIEEQLEFQNCKCSGEFAKFCNGRNPDAEESIKLGANGFMCVRKYFNRDINQSPQNAIVDDVGFRGQDLKGDVTKIILYTKLENMAKNARTRTLKGDGRIAQSILNFFFDIYKIEDSPTDILESLNFVQFQKIFESFPTVDECIKHGNPAIQRQFQGFRNAPEMTYDAEFAWKKLTKNNIACRTNTCYVKAQDKFKDFIPVKTSDENGDYMKPPEVADKIVTVYKAQSNDSSTSSAPDTLEKSTSSATDTLGKSTSSATNTLGNEFFFMIILMFVMSF